MREDRRSVEKVMNYSWEVSFDKRLPAEYDHCLVCNKNTFVNVSSRSCAVRTSEKIDKFSHMSESIRVGVEFITVNNWLDLDAPTREIEYLSGKVLRRKAGERKLR